MQITAKNVRIEAYGASKLFFFHIEKDGVLINEDDQQGSAPKEFVIQVEPNMDAQAECLAFIERVKARLEAEETEQTSPLLADLTV